MIGLGILSGKASIVTAIRIVANSAVAYNQQAAATVKVERIYVRDEQDVRSLAIEIAQLTKRQQAGMGIRR